MPSTNSTRCPTCKVEVTPPPENRCFPFCSERCRTIDLGRWLNEEYRLTSDATDDEDDGPSTPPSDA